MKCDEPNGPASRSAALARLLQEALDFKKAGDTQGTACPDAEVLAAYVEHGLSAQEVSRWESHIADCSRCQKIVTGVLVSGETVEGAELRKQAGVISAPAVRNSEQRPAMLEISRGPKPWRWWVPGLGLAAAVALWFVLHPSVSTSPALPTAAATPETPQSAAQASPAPSSAKPEETQMAEANVPPPPASLPGGSLRDSKEDRGSKPADALKKALPKQEAMQNERRASPESPAVSEVTQSGAAPAAKEKDDRAAPTPQTDTKTQATDALAETPAAPAAPAPKPLSAPAPEAAEAQSPTRQLDRARFSGTNQVKALAGTANSLIGFGTPDRSILWRVGPGGLIESSSDQGQTWRPQASGVTADLLAGAAPSSKIAWVVGKGGIILRTEDGEHWQRLMAPAPAQNATPADWTAIEAADELHATIVSRDLHRYVTADGGRTWVLQQ